jgi:outer membrane immunogenic protein
VKKLLLSGLALLAPAFVQPALAAGSPAAQYKPPTSNWTGPYVGAGLGGKWADSLWTATSVFDPPLPAGIKSVDASSPRQYDSLQARYGGYAGYNWQYQSWVFGLEADFFGGDRTVMKAGFPGCTIACVAGAPGPGNDTTSVAMKWDASVRARIGYKTSPDLMLYGTGGYAWQSMQSTGTCETSATDPFCFTGDGSLKTQTNSKTLTGWTAGGGLEWQLSRNLLLRSEYRYSHFKKWDDVFFPGQPAVNPGADTYRYQLRVNTSILTVGLAYRFD